MKRYLLIHQNIQNSIVISQTCTTFHYIQYLTGFISLSLMLTFFRQIKVFFYPNLTKEGIHEAKCLGSFFFFPSSKVSTTYQRTLSTGFCLHSLNDNSTVPWLLFLAVILGEVLEDSRSKGCWTETTQFRRILYSTLSSLFLSFPVSLSVSAFNPSVSFSDSCLFHILVFVFNLTWRCAHQCLLELSGKTYRDIQNNSFLVAKSLLKDCAKWFWIKTSFEFRHLSSRQLLFHI